LITPTAEQLVQDALEIMRERGATRDKPQGERAMAATVKAFNAVTGRDLSETEGWKFMMCLKLGRAAQGKFHADDYHDLIGYSALTAECAFREQTEKEIDAKLFADPGALLACPCEKALVARGATCPCGLLERV
jgi:hypothetical protein